MGWGSASDGPTARPFLTAPNRESNSMAGRRGGIRDPVSAAGRPLPAPHRQGVPMGQGLCLTSLCSQGIQWTPVEFFDNSIICDLIENVSSCPQCGAVRS